MQLFVAVLNAMSPIRSWKTYSPRRRRKTRAHYGAYHSRRFLLTRNESAFFRVLKTLVPAQFEISCKVRLADIVTYSHDKRHAPANRIRQKHVDFVISSARSSRIVAAIELDDSSHGRADRRARDAFLDRLFSQIGVKLVRVRARWHYDRDSIAECLVHAGVVMNAADADSRLGGAEQDEIVSSAQSPKAETLLDDLN
jgi:hypothetical protein